MTPTTYEDTLRELADARAEIAMLRSMIDDMLRYARLLQNVPDVYLLQGTEFDAGHEVRSEDDECPPSC